MVYDNKSLKFNCHIRNWLAFNIDFYISITVIQKNVDILTVRIDMPSGNNYMEGSGSATIKKVVHPKHPEEEETSPNKNHTITGKQQQTN